MKFNTLFIPLSFALIFVGLSACKKVEGPGGSSSIIGTIHVQELDGANNIMKEYDAPKYDVFLIYGGDTENTYFDDDIETSFDGSFKFNYLEKGKYQLFVYEDSIISNGGSGKYATIYPVEITEKKQENDLSVITVIKKF
ncbi:MAG: hypothetical protein JKY09_02745 [Crocinitomicaceae bacterium]|nr:hypothetical protein [Crocinitomicaceae bacterium]